MKLIKIGSKWWGGNNKTFEITDVKEQDGNDWVYYINVDTSQEYSCFAEAFLERFRGLPE